MSEGRNVVRRPRGGLARGLLLAAGVSLLAAFVWAAGPGAILANLTQIGPGFGYLILVSVAWRTCAATGMWVLFDRALGVRWWTIMLVRTAGESVNTLTPFGNVGGEPVKALMLKRYVGGTRGTGYVLLDKTIFFIASVTFMTTGTLLGAVLLAEHMVVFVVTAALLVPWTGVLIWAVWHQMRGDFVLSASRALALLRIRLSDEKRKTLVQVDESMSSFWAERRAMFFLSLALHFAGRALRTVDVWLTVWLLGANIDVSAAYFAAAAGMLVSSTFVFIPGALGASEGGHAFVFELIGLGVTAGVTVGIVRRIRTYLISALGYLIVVFWPAEAAAPRPAPEGNLIGSEATDAGHDEA